MHDVMRFSSTFRSFLVTLTLFTKKLLGFFHKMHTRSLSVRAFVLAKALRRKQTFLEGQSERPRHVWHAVSDQNINSLADPGNSLVTLCGRLKTVLGRTVLKGLVFGTLFSPHFGVKRNFFFKRNDAEAHVWPKSRYKTSPAKA